MTPGAQLVGRPTLPTTAAVRAATGNVAGYLTSVVAGAPHDGAVVAHPVVVDAVAVAVADVAARP